MDDMGVWKAESCAEYLRLLRTATAQDIARLNTSLDPSLRRGGFAALGSPLDTHIGNLKDRCITLEAQYRSVVERLENVEQELQRAARDAATLKESIVLNSKAMESEAKKEECQPVPSASVESAVPDMPPMASLEEQVEILKKALAAKAVENEVLRADYNDVKAASQRIVPEAESSPEPKRAADPAPPILLDAMPITMEGYLMKRGGKTDRKWQRRYCALELLQDANMYVITYRVKKGDSTSKGQIPLPWCQVEQTSDPKASNCFLVCPRITRSKMKNFCMSAPGETEMHGWMRAIECAAKRTPTAQKVLEMGYKHLDLSHELRKAGKT